MKENLKSYIIDLDEETQLLMDEYPQRDVAFTAYILDKISEMVNMDEYRVVHCVQYNSAHNVLGEIYGCSFNENKEVLTLIYSIYDPTAYQGVRTLQDTEYQVAVNRLQGFYKSAIRGLHLDYEDEGNTSDPIYDIARNIYDNQSTITTVRLLVLSNCTISKYDIKKLRINGKATYADVWDLKKIYANLHSGSDHAAIDVDFIDEYSRYKIPYIEMESNDFGYKCVVALFPGKLLFELYEKHNTDLLQSNVRFFLGFKGSDKTNANKGILKTLKEENQMFLAYNNGITALANSIESVSQSNKTDISEESKGNEFISTGILSAIRDFRIVNGGQTTASIFSAKNNNREISLKGVYVQVKIIVQEKQNDDVVSNITKYSNSQSKIKYSDFSVSNAFNKRMEELSRAILVPNKNNEPKYWYFERVRGQYEQEFNKVKTRKDEKEYFLMKYPKKQVFKKEELAKVWKSWNQEPYDAVKGEATNYGSFIGTVHKDFTDYDNQHLEFPEKVKTKDGGIERGSCKPDETFYRHSIALLILYRFLIQRPECKQYGNRKATIATYTLAYLNNITQGRLNLDKIWKEQKLSDNLIAFLIQVSESINETVIELAGDIAVFSWGKRKQSFREILNYGITCDTSLLNDEKV